MNRRGFTIVEVLIIVVIAAIIGLLGFAAYNQFLKTDIVTSETTAAPTSVTKVESSSDLDKATADLEAIDLSDSTETSTLDSQTVGF